MNSDGAHQNEILLSVAVTNYNYGKYLRRCLDSILSQSFKNFELIIIDNKSTDDSIVILEEYAEKYDCIRLILHEKNVDLRLSLQESFDISRGKYGVHLDPDDWIINSDAFSMQINVLENNPDVSFVYSHRSYHNFEGKSWLSVPPHSNDVISPGEKEIYNALTWCVAHSGPMFRLDAFRAIGGYRSDFDQAMDVILPADLCTQGKVAFIKTPLYTTFEHLINRHRSISIHTYLDEVLRGIQLIFSEPFSQRIPCANYKRNKLISSIYLKFSSHYFFTNNEHEGWKWMYKIARYYPAFIFIHLGVFPTIFHGVKSSFNKFIRSKSKQNDPLSAQK